jgi:hypothetical protein
MERTDEEQAATIHVEYQNMATSATCTRNETGVGQPSLVVGAGGPDDETAQRHRQGIDFTAGRAWGKFGIAFVFLAIGFCLR